MLSSHINQKRKWISFLCFLLGCCTIVIGQSNKRIVANQIGELKNGVLLVRLQKQNRKIKVLTEQANHKAVQQVKANVKATNEAIVEAFIAYFDFCDIYFFYSDDSDAIKKGDYSLLFDAQYNPVGSLEKQHIYYAAFTYKDIGEPYLTSRKRFVVMDKNFKQLKAPFLYYDFFRKTNIQLLLDFLSQKNSSKKKKYKPKK